MEFIITALIVGFALFSLGRHFYKALQSTDNNNCGCGSGSCGCGGCGGCGGNCNSNDHKSDNETKPSNQPPTPELTKMTMVAEN